MTVYVESNFVLEIALNQQQAIAANAILRRAETREIDLGIPAFALSEPFSTITRRARELARLAGQLDQHLQRRAEWEAHRDDITAIDLSEAFLARFELRETESLMGTVGRLLNAARVIPFDLAVLQRAVQMRDPYGLDSADALILASVVHDMIVNVRPGPHIFISKNSRDFGTHDVAAELDALDCVYVSSFTEVAAILEPFLPEWPGNIL